jgi:TIR domain
MDFKIFVSYSTHDLDQVNLLRQQLANTPVNIPFVAEYSVLPSQELAKEISKAIEDCDLFVVLWSENASNSEWVRQEIGSASALKRTILPLVLTEGLKLPGFIKELKYIDVFLDPNLALSQAREMVILEYNKKVSLTQQKEQEQKNTTLFLMGVGAFLLWAINQK